MKCWLGKREGHRATVESWRAQATVAKGVKPRRQQAEGAGPTAASGAVRDREEVRVTRTRYPTS